MLCNVEDTIRRINEMTLRRCEREWLDTDEDPQQDCEPDENPEEDMQE
jgi:hypothetical protein